MRRRSGRVVALVVAGVLALSACTGDPADETAGDGSPGDGTAAGPVEATGSARTVTGSMGETTSDIPDGSGVKGTVTITLRAVDVSEQTMTVRWATRWDGEDAEPNAVLSYYDMGLGTAATVIDATNLKVYRPFCTNGSWKGEGAEPVTCEDSMVSSVRDVVAARLPNHGTVEGWASMPAPEGKPEKVDVMPIEGLPGFTQADVTYLDGDS